MIVVFGSINADLIFRLDRLPAAGQTLLAESLSMQPGGKGANQAVAAARDGAVVRMVGAVGDDALAATALSLLRAEGVDLGGLRVAAGQATGCAGICTDHAGRNQIAVALGANGTLAAAEVPDALLGPETTLLLQMEAPLGATEALIGRARRAGARIVLNLAPALTLDRAALAMVDLLLVNEDEAVALDAMLGGATLPETTVVRTLGAAGAAAGALHVAAPRVEVVDTTAAGDCFAGVLASGLDRGLGLEPAMRRAVAAASLACRREGSQASLPRGTETDAFLAELDRSR